MSMERSSLQEGKKKNKKRKPCLVRTQTPGDMELVMEL